ncbi:hypothetical protein V8D89_012122 [Ganoderma adspersum]
MFADEMDLLLLTAWRWTCKTNYHQAVSLFKHSLTARLDCFVPYLPKLVDIMNDHRTVFGGEFALAFIVRDDSYHHKTLEIFIGDFMFDPPIRDRIDRQWHMTHTLFFALPHLIAQTLLICMKNGYTIYMHQSFTPSVVAPVTHTPCTVLSNFVTGYGFTCSHPRLTLHLRALLANQELAFIDLFDRSLLGNLDRMGFPIEVSPSAWTEYRRARTLLLTGVASATDDDDDDVENSETGRTGNRCQECWRDLYICPTQGRFFGDKGSFVDFFDPLSGGETHCAENNIPPLGPMIVWHVMYTFDCDEGCDLYDEVLEEGIASIPALFRNAYDPYSEIRNLIIDRNDRMYWLQRAER